MEPPSAYPFTIALYLRALDPVTGVVITAIALLLVASAAMSASEVALFSLTPTQLRDLKERGGSAGQRVLDQGEKQGQALAC